MMDKRKMVMVWVAALVLAVGCVFESTAGAQTKAPAKLQAKAPQITRIDLNKATAEQLSKCPGVTPTLAKAITEYREKTGPFRTPEDLLKVKGMTKEILNKLSVKVEKNILYVAPAAPSSDEDEEEPSLKPSKC